jgi:PKD repeat protein
VSGATGYSWTVPVGASVASGQGTTSIAVNWGTATFGNVTVTPTNSCFSNTASSLFVTVIQKPVAGPITGSSAVCSNASGVAYSIATVSWATGYNWTLPVGATVASGQNTTNITVNWGTASSGNVTVTPTNSCFSGTASSLPVTVNVPPIVTSPPTNLTVCAGSLASFSATGSGSPAPGVQWQRSTDSGTNWIDLAGATNLTHGFSTILGDDNSQYRVALSNECGTAASGTATLTVLPGQLSVSPAQWNFGAVATGVTAQATFIVTNTGCGQLSGTATSTAPFAVVAGNAYALAGFGATNVTVSFTPLMEGWFTNAVIFTSDGGSATNTVIGQGAIVPVALFSASPTNGVEPLVVAFTDQSTGTITNRFWDFGDGNNTNITSTSVTNTYAAGNYTVTLIVSGPLGIISTNTQAIGVLTPFAQWQMDYFGCTVCPEALASADPDGDGMSNTNEFLAGFNPTNNAARLRIINLTPSSVNMVITYLGADGDANGSPGPKTNVVEYTLGLAGVYSNNFQSLGWTNILTGGNGTGTVVIATDTNGATSNPARYYRIRVLTP